MEHVNWRRIVTVLPIYIIGGALAGLGFGALGNAIASVEVGLLAMFAAAIFLVPVIYLIISSVLVSAGVGLGFDPQSQRQRSLHALLFLAVMIPAILVSVSV